MWILLDSLTAFAAIAAVLGAAVRTSLPYIPLSADLPVAHDLGTASAREQQLTIILIVLCAFLMFLAYLQMPSDSSTQNAAPDSGGVQAQQQAAGGAPGMAANPAKAHQIESQTGSEVDSTLLAGICVGVGLMIFFFLGLMAPSFIILPSVGLISALAVLGAIFLAWKFRDILALWRPSAGAEGGRVASGGHGWFWSRPKHLGH